MGSWIDLFATTYKVSDDADVKHRATTLLRDKFSMGAISICLQIYTDSMSGMEVKIYETHAIPVEEMAKCREIERLHFDTLVQTHPELAFMTSGCAGRIKYQIIPTVNEEHSHIQFNELERAPILDLNQRRFRQSVRRRKEDQRRSTAVGEGRSSSIGSRRRRRTTFAA